MKKKGTKFSPESVTEWLDCGNKDATVYTNQRILELNKNDQLIAKSMKKNNSVVIEPCFIGENVEINDSIVGPHVSIGDNSKINDSVIKNSIIQNNTKVKNVVITNSMLGSFVEYSAKMKELSIGDYSTQV